MFFYPALATNIYTDKSSYNFEDIVHISGTVSPVQDGQFIILQITSPGDSDIVTADQFLPSADGSFSRSYPAEGPKWTLDGMYTVKIFYENWSETTFQFQSESEPEPPSNSKKTNLDDSSSDTESKNKEQGNAIAEPSKIKTQNSKTKIPGFPDLNKSPDHYFERYEKEPSYKDWFDSQFPDLSIQEVVGYEPTHVTDFPASSKSPQSYRPIQ